MPPFYVRDKTVSFPKIKNRKEFVQEELNKRELVWNDNHQVIGEEGAGHSSVEGDSNEEREFAFTS